jgi:flavin-dependent dehydrogenase
MPRPIEGELRLEPGSRIGVIGGGPAGALFAAFALDLSRRLVLDLEVEVWEPRNFARPGPAGCNMCGGIISESLVESLSIEGVPLPPEVVQRAIDSYVLHTDVGSVRIATPLAEMRIGAVHRGAGPKGTVEPRWSSLDHHLLSRAVEAGARLVNARVERFERGTDGKPVVVGKDGTRSTVDLVVGAVGVNSPLLKQFEGLGIAYERPRTTRTLIREYELGGEAIERSLGTSMHVFLLDLPGLEFAAAIPKGDHVTVAALGEDLDEEVVDALMRRPEVRGCFPPGWDPAVHACQCQPAMAVQPAPRPYADRFVFVGDSGVTRLYKDGIGAAYRTAKAAAVTALTVGVSKQAFGRGYGPVCRSIERDNGFGQVAFLLTRLARKLRPLRHAMLRMAAREQHQPGARRAMSRVLWDIFSGSAPYADIFARMLAPAFLARLAGDVLASLRPRGEEIP